MTQKERLNYLLEQFKAETTAYRNLSVAEADKWNALRSLMNIRPPRRMDKETLQIQDAYLTQAARERGIVPAAEIPTVQTQYESVHPFADRLSVWRGDITSLNVDAIVNAANSQMLGCFIPLHTCIDNCIHTCAGIQLRAECARQMAILRKRYGSGYEQPVAVPMLTEGYNLPARHVIHVVGPTVDGPLTPRLEEDLAKCYRNTLDLCAESELKSVAFCCISTGVFRFPNDRAAEIAVKTVTDWFSANQNRQMRVIFNVHSEKSQRLYENLLR